ncbi:lipoprotein [Plesiomonas shigelloides]|uniref:lipoprotein n=1 Tax=Plesiomonas shigelloides TaxID=703 RepID=UPI0032603D8A
MKKYVITILSLATLAGCAKKPAEMLTSDLCFEYGYTLKSGDIERFSLIKAELNNRKDLTLDDCKSFAIVGTNRVEQDRVNAARSAQISAALLQAGATMNAGNNISNSINNAGSNISNSINNINHY